MLWRAIIVVPTGSDGAITALTATADLIRLPHRSGRTTKLIVVLQRASLDQNHGLLTWFELRGHVWGIALLGCRILVMRPTPVSASTSFI